jgi:hypothetical protein
MNNLGTPPKNWLLLQKLIIDQRSFFKISNLFIFFVGWGSCWWLLTGGCCTEVVLNTRLTVQSTLCTMTTLGA